MTYEQAEQIISLLINIHELNNILIGISASIIASIIVMIFFVAKGDINS